MSVSRNRLLVRRWGRSPRRLTVVVVLAVACSMETRPVAPLVASTARLTVRVTTVAEHPFPAAYVRAVSSSTIDLAAIGADGSAHLTVPIRDTVDLVVGGTGARLITAPVGASAFHVMRRLTRPAA